MLAHFEPHLSSHSAKLNWLRAAVLGANDGIVSIAGLVLGVAGATSSREAILTAGGLLILLVGISRFRKMRKEIDTIRTL